MKKDEERDLLDWLGMRSAPAYWLARWLGGAAGVAIIVVLMLAVAVVFKVLVLAVFFDLPDTPGAGLGAGAVAGAIIGAPFVIWRAIVAQKTVDVAQESVDVQEQGRITDRFYQAVQGLGAVREVRRDNAHQTEENLEVRIGAIYALERIAQDSDRDHVQIMEILCAYIRENAKTIDLAPTEPPLERGALRADLQAAIDVIGRRSEKQITIEKAQRYRLDLRGTDLTFANFARGDFSAAILADCRLESCNFRDSNFSAAILHRSVLNFSDFFRCNLTGARLDASKINRPVSQPGGWVWSIDMGELKGVSFPSADFSALQNLGSPDKMNQMMGSIDTILSDKLRREMPPSDVMKHNVFRGMLKLSDKSVQALKQIEDAGFKYWFPFDAKRDSAFGSEREKFLKSMGLDGWPYIEE